MTSGNCFFLAPLKKGRPPGDEIGDPYKWPNIKMGFSGRGYFIPTYRRKQLTWVVTDRGPPWTDDVSLCLRLPRWVFLVPWKHTIKRSVHQKKNQLSPLWKTFRVWNCINKRPCFSNHRNNSEDLIKTKHVVLKVFFVSKASFEAQRRSRVKSWQNPMVILVRYLCESNTDIYIYIDTNG